MVQKFRLYVLIIFGLLSVAICLFAYKYVTREVYAPLHFLHKDSFPTFIDDLDRPSLVDSTRRHLAYLKRQNPQKTITLGSDSYSYAWLHHSAEKFLEKLTPKISQDELAHYLANNYHVYQAGGRKDHGGRRMLVTGYYEPTFEGSLTKQPPFLTPIYSPPSSLVIVSGEHGKGQTGRLDHNKNLVPYWSRREIETEPQHLQGYELAYLKDPFDAFLLHIQGSGRIRFPDKSERSVRFAGSNGLEYQSIGKLLVDEKRLTLDEVTIPAIRDYLKQHPELQQRILHHNPRFIFFSWGDNLGPKGSSGEILTPGRSIAIDHSALPGGALGYLVTRMPVMGSDGQVLRWRSVARFVLPQDSGAAIRGTGRVDVFFGHGTYAEFAANHMKEEGQLYFLVKKQDTPQ